MNRKKKQVCTKQNNDKKKKSEKMKRWADGKEGNGGIVYFETKGQAIKTIETLNRSKPYIAKQYKMKMNPRNKRNKAKHFQTIGKKKINGQNTKEEKTEGLSDK